MRIHHAIYSSLRGSCLNCQSCLSIRFCFLFGGFAASGDYLRSHVVALFGLFIVLLGQHHGGTPDYDETITFGSDTPYTTSVDANRY